MKKSHQNILLSITIMLTFLLTNCRKDIPIPSSELENLFSTWTMYELSGGFGGGIYKPDGIQTIEFDRSGICKSFKDGKLLDKNTFTLSESFNFGSKIAYTITYKETVVFVKNKISKYQTISFRGSDTLSLYDPCCDQYQYNYVKNK